jgi:hypothetical protein
VVDKADERAGLTWAKDFSLAGGSDLLNGYPDRNPSLGVNAIAKALQSHRSSGHATGGHQARPRDSRAAAAIY